MKKRDYLEIFLFLICAVCFFVSLANIAGILTDLSTIIFQESTNLSEGYNPILYAQRGLFVNIPMGLISSSITYVTYKRAIKVNKENKDSK